MKAITDDILKEITKRLVNSIHPDKLVLFGSRARGDNRPDSDIDIMIIKDSTAPKHIRAAYVLNF